MNLAVKPTAFATWCRRGTVWGCRSGTKWCRSGGTFAVAFGTFRTLGSHRCAISTNHGWSSTEFRVLQQHRFHHHFKVQALLGAHQNQTLAFLRKSAPIKEPCTHALGVIRQTDVDTNTSKASLGPPEAIHKGSHGFTWVSPQVLKLTQEFALLVHHLLLHRRSKGFDDLVYAVIDVDLRDWCMFQLLFSFSLKWVVES